MARQRGGELCKLGVMLRTRVLLAVFPFSFYGQNSIKFPSPPPPSPFLIMALRNFVYGTRVFSKSSFRCWKIAARFSHEKFEKLDRIGFPEIQKKQIASMLHFDDEYSQLIFNINFSFILYPSRFFLFFYKIQNDFISKINVTSKIKLVPSSKKYIYISKGIWGRIIRVDRHRKETKDVTRSDADGMEIKRINLSVDGRKTWMGRWRV